MKGSYLVKSTIAKLIDKLQNKGISERNAAITAAAARRKERFAVRACAKQQTTNRREADDKIRICLITEEIASAGRSGGIGAAFLELAQVLSHCQDIETTLLYANPWEGAKEEVARSLELFAELHSIRVAVLDPALYVNPPFTPEKLSYAVLQWMLSAKSQPLETSWDFVHFHDYKGLGYYPALFNRQRPNVIAKHIVVQAHGPSRWALEANSRFWSHEEQLTIDFLERKSLEYCNLVISPSRYLIDWLERQGWSLAGGDKEQVVVLQNPRSSSISRIQSAQDISPRPSVREIVFFGRHEERKGLPIFISAIDRLRRASELPENVRITILGGLGEIGEIPSLLYLRDSLKGWNHVDLQLLTDYNRSQVEAYLAVNSHEKLVCICSPYENSPYTVVEAIEAGCMVITSNAGGAKEIINIGSGYNGVISMNALDLAEAIKDAIKNPNAYLCRFRFESTELNSAWEEIHRLKGDSCAISTICKSCFLQAIDANSLPLVSFILTHFERPLKLAEALTSVILQTYPKIEIIVVDDGSSPDTVNELGKNIKPMLELCGGKLVYRENGYLGAARNTGLSYATGEFVIFMDDDDIAMPELTERLVESAMNFPSDVTVAINSYMPVSQRSHWRAARFSNEYPIPSYIPVGDLRSLAPLHNVYGGCTSLISAKKIRDVGGYSELRDVGHEDYELYARLTGAGASLTVHPSVLYLYETDRPSMLSRTTLWRNFKRSIEAHKISRETLDLVLCIKGKTILEMRHSRLAWMLKDDSAVNILNVWPDPEQSIQLMIEQTKDSPEDRVFCRALGIQ